MYYLFQKLKQKKLEMMSQNEVSDGQLKGQGMVSFGLWVGMMYLKFPGSAWCPNACTFPSSTF